MSKDRIVISTTRLLEDARLLSELLFQLKEEIENLKKRIEKIDGLWEEKEQESLCQSLKEKCGILDEVTESITYLYELSQYAGRSYEKCENQAIQILSEL